MLLLWYHYRDVSREGDGDRLNAFMPVLLSIFKNAKRKNYSKEVAIFILQHEYLLSPRMKEQLLFCRTVNTHGIKGRNIPCDLHMEHLNRLECSLWQSPITAPTYAFISFTNAEHYTHKGMPYLIHRNLKTSMGDSGANITPAVIQRCGRTLQPLTDLARKFHQPSSEVHSKAKEELDMNVVTNCLLANGVFSDEETKIPNLEKQKTFLGSLNKKNFAAWLRKTLEVEVH